VQVARGELARGHQRVEVADGEQAILDIHEALIADLLVGAVHVDIGEPVMSATVVWVSGHLQDKPLVRPAARRRMTPSVIE
jgi:hypothetical protein